jgi:REP element-mobilizing transposase RayT
MSRPLRIEYENAYYHVMNRGRGRRTIFHSDEYFEAFLKTLDETHQRFGLQVHAYCLLSNHYHLLVKTPEGNLQRSMRHVGGVYTQRYNRMKKTDGPLFRGRYKAILVDQDSYLLQLSKYIHRNPLAAGMVVRLEDHEWSSYPAYIGADKPSSWLYQQEVYEQLTGSRQRKRKYQQFVDDSNMPDSFLKFYNRQRLDPILGGRDFINRIKPLFRQSATDVSHAELQSFRPSIDQIVSAVTDFYGLQKVDIYKVKKGRGQSNQPRKIAMYLAQHIGGHRLTEIAQAFGLSHYGGVSNAIYMLKAEMSEDKALSRTINTIINGLDP